LLGVNITFASCTDFQIPDLFQPILLAFFFLKQDMCASFVAFAFLVPARSILAFGGGSTRLASRGASLDASSCWVLTFLFVLLISIPDFVFVVLLSLFLVDVIGSSIYRACVPVFRHRAYKLLARLMPVELVSGCMSGFLETPLRRWLLCWV
jgi:hypothetical protein